CVRDQSNLDFW
nr:immunoglobulin heavy chain junction region [Macaca mulatta]MOV49824.1 immunoglobulin heavy chain junction region [Macaca mulatta]MOV50069.1 immunoglobulin heavy chain junction region [Macaca mulatta]MOV50207.1 immunoglobulin heavy chain junction region [Macaca mulatta]MOV50805.1 immunoglobulin heavy chain junction region [Macaca mulatta]